MSRNEVLSIMARNRQQRGETSEARADLAAEILIATQVLSSWWVASDSQNQLGIDRVGLRYQDAVIVPVQVKSSHTGRKAAKAHHPDIPVLVIRPGEELKLITSRLEKLILDYCAV